jgi:hypothetical protein
MCRCRASVTDGARTRERSDLDFFLPCVVVINLRDDDLIDFFVG